MFNKEHTQTNTFHTWHKQIMIQDRSKTRNCINTRESLYTIYTYYYLSITNTQIVRLFLLLDLKENLMH